MSFWLRLYKLYPVTASRNHLVRCKALRMIHFVFLVDTFLEIISVLFNQTVYKISESIQILYFQVIELSI